MMNDELDVSQQPGDPQQTQQSPQQPAPDPQAQYAYAQQQTADQQAQYAYAQQQAAGQQAQYGYTQQQAQYAYAQQQAQYAAYAAQQQAYTPRPARSQHGKGGGWITFLRVFLWIWFALLCLAGVVLCVGSFGVASAIRYSDRAMMMRLTGVGELLGCILLAFLSVAGGMVALDAAANIKRTATNSARILELLQKQDK